MYVNKQLTDETAEIHRNKQNILYTEVAPAHYVVAIESADGWHYGLKIWRWDINAMFPSHVVFLSTAGFNIPREAFNEGMAAYRRITGGDHA